MSAHPLRLADLFTDHAVLQQGVMVPVWGIMPAEARVRVTLGKYSGQTVSARNGKFLVRLPAMPAGGPYELTVEAPDSGEKAVVRDVWVGEVWLASGQSNMEWTVCQLAREGDASLATAEVRMINIPRVALAGRQSSVTANWMTGEAEDDRSTFSAVGLFFARRVAREMGCKVGIVNASWGGTIVEAWTSRESLSRNPDTAGWLASYEAITNSEAFWQERYAMTGAQEKQASPYPADPGNEGFGRGWAKAELDDNSWPEMKIPGTWDSQGHKFNGVFWFRKVVEVPAAWAGKDLELNIGAVDKQEVTYFNGTQVGETGKGFDESCWNMPRRYVVPGGLVKAGRNVIAVRACSFVFNGGMIGPANRMKLLPVGGGEPIQLSGQWKYQVEHNYGLVMPCSANQLPPGPGCPNSPGILYDNMIAPLVPYALRGAIWYQGESNTDNPRAVNPRQYQSAIRNLMRDWRFLWGQGDFAFLQVQLANYREAQPYQENSTWAYLRESQRLSLREGNAGMAVIIDAGDAGNIHPADKETVGERLAQWALANTYHKPIVSSGPLYAGMTNEGTRIRVRFDCVGGGLLARGGALKTFFIAGENRSFVEAQAVIEGETVVVSCPEVPQPLAVRYAWADNPEGCNLYNADGLPASPFRTDCW